MNRFDNTLLVSVFYANHVYLLQFLMDCFRDVSNMNRFDNSHF